MHRQRERSCHDNGGKGREMMQTSVATLQTTAPVGRPLLYADRGLDALGVVLLAAEVLVLFASIVSRTVFLHPLIWSTEFAQLVFVWFTMVGSAIAVRDDRHMRMTAFVETLRPAWQARLRAAADVAQLAAVLAMIKPSLDFLQIERLLSLSQLGISSA